MKIDNQHYCDWCCVQFDEHPNNGRLFAGYESAKDFRGASFNRHKFAVHALFGHLLCQDCDNAVKRNRAPKIPANPEIMKYVRRIERGDVKPPWRDAKLTDKDGNRIPCPQKVKAARC